ncbi:MAG: hypothetical protein CMO01_28695 [Thalassobius sp.]|nr:hypothetical protein [Thalassovita sp.]
MNLKLITSIFTLIFVLFFNFFSSDLKETKDIVLKEKYLGGKFPRLATGQPFLLEQTFTSLSFNSEELTRIISVPDVDQFLALGRTGSVWIFNGDESTTAATLLVDLSDRVVSSSNAGLLGAAFHPDFNNSASDHYREIYFFYTYKYTSSAPTYDIISKFKFSDSMDAILSDSEEILIQHYDRNFNNNGGDMFFGNDGYLYISFGDEGGSYDPFDNAQEITNKFFGGILRIDVDNDTENSHAIRKYPSTTDIPNGYPDNINQNYSIPNDNPWLSESGENLEEYYAIGFRNPENMFYDSETEQIWVADIGQVRREEVSIITKGDNAQWPFMEGNYPYDHTPAVILGTEVSPVLHYTHTEGSHIIGGLVYKNSKFGRLQNKYIYGDNSNGNVSYIDPEKDYAVTSIADGNDGLVSFFTNDDGDVYLAYENGDIYKFVDNNVVEPPTLLSETEAFTDFTTMEPAEGILPYEINVPFWSDGAEKYRWISIPADSEGISFNTDSSYTFPIGTVFIKHFEIPNSATTMRKIETRFFIVDEEGQGYGLTYRWNEEGTDAELIPDDEYLTDELTVYKDGILSTQTWEYPARAQCIECHNDNIGYGLGVRTTQLNKMQVDESTGLEKNQLIVWKDHGFFADMEGDLDLDALEKVVQVTDTTASLEFRVRSYLEVNCAFCHRPNGVDANFDARLTTPLHDQNLINAEVIGRDSGIGNKIVFPLNPDSSEIWVRDNSLAYTKMPPIAKNVLDEEYLVVLKDWINNLKYSSEEAITLCEGESYTFPDGTTISDIDTAFTYQSQFTAEDGLDSVIVTQVEVTKIDGTISVNSITQLTANEDDETATYQWVDCSNDNAILDGETSRSLSTTEIGSYAVMITKNGCTVTSECASITGIMENSFGEGLQVYPNPTSGILNLSFGERIDNGNIRITDLTGKEVYNTTLQNQNQISMNLSIKQGIYLMTITDNKKRRAIIKFLKE